MGSFTCTCPTGYLGDGFTCTDINECDSDNGNCPSTASCNNNEGSFTCTCPAGYYYDGSTCEDIDECSPGQVHSCDTFTSECVNTPGDYYCSCKPGYSGRIYFPSRGDTVTCQDIDECSPGQVHSCDTITSECMNTPGDYFCSCKPGYPGMTYFPSRGDTVTCQDCIAVVNTFCMNPGVSCDCMDESCDPDTGICSSSCTIVNICPASVESKSLSQVNPSSSVDVNCTLRGSTTILQSLQLRLSSKLDSLDDDGITRLTGNGVNTGDKVVSTFRVESVTKEQTLFCVLLQGTYLIGGVSVKNFVHELPVLTAAPISEDVSKTSITISWRAWDPTIDDGDPPIVAYISYYRMDASDEWISGPKVLTNETLQFKADNLEVDTLYEFSVAVVREGENGEGLRSPVVPLKTCCNDTSAPVYLISLIAIPVLLIALIVVSIIIRKHISKDKRPRKADDGEDNDYVNAAMADDPEDYISLEEQSRTVSSSKYEDLDHKPQGGASIPQQYFTIVPEPQKPVATPKYWTRNMKGVNSGAYEDEGVSSENRQLPNVLQSHPSGDGDKDNSYEVPDRLEEYTGVYINIKNKRKLIQPGPIKVAEFQNFMSRKKEDVVTDIVQQFMALPSGGQYSWSVALKFQNKPRNFSKFILAYDHSRVKLDTNGSDARSDYINASYIKNLQGKKSFIAAQGPQEGTVDDFWKMVWQENVETIVMVTDNIEKNKILCSTYWPNKVHMGEVYGDITVILMESTSYTSHTIRKLNLLKGNHKAEVHTVTQIHVHSWPYGSVPKEPASLISVIKKVKSLQTDGSSSPLLVHCSNGVGATGTFIAVYVLMDTIKKNKDVNIFDFVKNMRDDRVDMVQTRVQYLFIFECLLAVIQSTDSQISCDQLKKLGHAAIKLKSKKEYKVLQDSVIEEQHCEDYTGNSPENQHKNRFKNIIPVDRFRPVLKSQGNMFGSNSYINANHLVKSVSVDHFAFCGWSGNQPDVSKLRQFIRYTGNKRTGPVLVHCINGVGLSAVYVIVKTESEKLEEEGSADIFQCLTKLRKICPLAIITQEQYTLCYQLLKDHLDNPEEYAVVY
ncbi:Receptor-type tyrosine-protein phosphatase T [Holothuria leucospilota]|uniref:protein-tyrosine-phosphatase n=1 Tax=Holothuria leucospilota TaxID=206669 RepID=A0A9Q1HCK5_HOLLE|nr:Receptor-type tyrosine-protein phosphatase T [Holothuria leucospilota]